MIRDWLARHWFLVGLASVAALAFTVPETGARGGPLRPEITTKAGVATIFFLQGLALAPEVLRAGAMHWRLHVATQLSIFLAFPLLALAFDAVAGAMLQPELRLGLLFLAVLPTTISTCVVFTAAAGGNVSASLFNAALANVAGVVITPLLAAALLRVRGDAPPVLPVLTEIGLLLLAPLVAGQFARRLLRRHRLPRRPLVNAVSSVIILYIVFAAFAESVHTGAFRATGPAEMAGVGGAAVALFLGATGLAAVSAHALRFPRGDRIALLFGAPQKTLAAGAPMGQILFAGHGPVGLILLPLLVYHIVQLVVGSAIVDRLRGGAHGPGRRTAAPTATGPP